MTNSVPLLPLSNAAAHKEIVKEALKPGVNADYLTVGQYSVRSDGDVNLPVFVDSAAYDDPNWKYVGDVEMRYKRLDLNETFGHLHLTFRCPDGIYRTADILSRMASIFGFSLPPTDFLLDTRLFNVMQTTFTLTAAPDSARWKGSVNVLIRR